MINEQEEHNDELKKQTNLQGVEVNVVKIYDDNNFSHAKHLCCDNFDWDQVYRKKSTIVWVKPDPVSGFDMIKARTEYDFSAELLYDVLQDAEFRPKWDRYMIEQVDMGFLNPNHDLCYYAMGSFTPFKSRDFVLQRAWLDLDGEKLICSHSVCHRDYPPRSTHIRGIVNLTVYFIRALSKNSCQLTYLTHSDPKGKLPTWIINKITKIVAPQIFKKLHKACEQYPHWKSKNKPNFKPWRFPEQQLDFPRINVEMCVPVEYQQKVLDESKIDEEDVVKIADE